MKTYHRALQNAGCKRESPGKFRIGRNLTIGTTSPTNLWQRWASCSLTTGSAGDGDDPTLEESFAPGGPFKLLPAGHGNSVKLVADVPLGFPRHQNLPVDRLEDGGLDPQAGTSLQDLWAANLVEEVKRLDDPRRDRHNGGASFPPATTLRDWLQEGGWKASVADGGVSVQLQGLDYFREVIVQPDQARGTRLDLELSAFSTLHPLSIAALARLAREANQQMKLVRVLWRHGQNRRSLVAQVHLGRLPVFSPWTHLAIDALRAAAASLVCEAQALEDPQLAELFFKALNQKERSS